MKQAASSLAPQLDSLGRWHWPDPDCECVRMLRRTGRFRQVLTAWLEEQITAMVQLSPERVQQLENPEAIRQERLRLFREAAFSLHVEEHFSRSKRDRDRIDIRKHFSINESRRPENVENRSLLLSNFTNLEFDCSLKHDGIIEEAVYLPIQRHTCEDFDVVQLST